MAKKVAKNGKMMGGNNNPNGQMHANPKQHGKNITDWSYRLPPAPERLGDSQFFPSPVVRGLHLRNEKSII